MNHTLLYVEDEENDVILVQMAAKTAGLRCRFVVTEDGEQAIDYLQGNGAFADREQHPLPTAVLLDLNLPRRTGFEVLEWIRQQPQFKDLPVLIYTSSSSEKDRTQTTGLGANAYYLKPSKQTERITLLQDIERQWLSQR